MENKITRQVPLVCPFCDEIAYQEPHTHRLITAHRIYTLRICPMGHRFYSVEEVPENQSEIVDEIRSIKDARRAKHE